MNPNWTRWIKASINDFMLNQDRADASLKESPVPFFVEGQVRANERPNVWMEVRIDGPFYNQISRNFWEVVLEVNHVVSVLMDEEDLYVYDKVIGLAQGAYQNCIPVYKYGSGPDDDDTGLFELIRSERPLDTVQYGQVDEKTRLIQGSVTGEYIGHICV